MNKLLLEWGQGGTIVREVAENARAAGVDDLIVVTGHEAERVKRALECMECTFVDNPSYRDGLASSLKAGFNAAIGSGAPGALILLGDMPLVTAAVIGRVIEAAAANPECLVQPVAEGMPAHPVWLPKRIKLAIDRLEGDSGARALIAGEGDNVVNVEVPASASVDLDTVDDYRDAIGTLT